ncbi:MAG TPA: hypothetical protein VF644_06665 [Pyrinomonadaceae bacterium]|jgi:hypothetical protein
MLSTVFTILLDIKLQSVGFNEDAWVLMAGVGLIVLVFVLRRWFRGGKKDETNLLF